MERPKIIIIKVEVAAHAGVEVGVVVGDRGVGLGGSCWPHRRDTGTSQHAPVEAPGRGERTHAQTRPKN